MHASIKGGKAAVLAIVLACIQGNAQWAQTSGPYGGDVNTLYADTSVVLAASPSRLYRSVDHGDSWTLTGFPIGTGVTALGAHGGYLIAGNVGGRLFRSGDNGATWEKANVVLLGEVKKIVSAGPNIFAGGGVGVLRSGNSGETWTDANNGLRNKPIHDMAAGGGYVYVSMKFQGVYRSPADGSFWTLVYSGSDAKTLAASGPFVILSTNTGVVFSGDHGNTWKEVYAHGIPTEEFPPMLLQDSILYAYLNGHVYKSGDAGAHWTRLSPDLPFLNADKPLDIAGDGSRLYVTNVHGVFRSSDGGVQWEAINRGIIGTTIETLIPAGECLLARTRTHGFFRTCDNGETWTVIPASDFTIGTALSQNGQVWAGGTGGLQHSPDQGATWKWVPSLDIPVHSLGGDGNALFAGSSGGRLRRSLNDGLTWATPAWNQEPLVANNDLSLLYAHPGALYANGDGNESFYGSYDLGETWNRLALLRAKYVTSWQNDLYVVWHGTSASRSSDQGRSWTNILGTGKSSNILAGPGYLLVGTYNSVFYSLNRGDTWKQFGSGLENQSVTVLAENSTHVFVGTDLRGVWKIAKP